MSDELEEDRPSEDTDLPPLGPGQFRCSKEIAGKRVSVRFSPSRR